MIVGNDDDDDVNDGFGGNVTKIMTVWWAA